MKNKNNKYEFLIVLNILSVFFILLLSSSVFFILLLSSINKYPFLNNFMVKMQKKINYYHFKTYLTTPCTGNDIERFKKIEESVSRNNQLSKEEKFNLLERFKDEKDYFFVLNGENEAERLCTNCNTFCLATKYCEKCVKLFEKSNLEFWKRRS